MKRELEALLFATDSPLTLARIKKILPGVETAEIREAITELEAEYNEQENAFTVVEFGGGWQIATRPEFSPTVEKMLKGRRFTRLSKAGLEVLAIVAYRQPITRLEVDEIRGVNSSGSISTLTERNLVTVVGRSQTVGNPLLYGTTREFLNHLGLKGLGQLPDLPDLENVLEDKDGLKEFASQVGRDVSDEELEDYFAAPEVSEVILEGDLPAKDGAVDVSDDTTDPPNETEPESEVMEGSSEDTPLELESESSDEDPVADIEKDSEEDQLRQDHSEN